MSEHSKWTFWGLAFAAMCLICIPSSSLLDALKGYRRFLSGFQPPLQPTHARYNPHGEDRAGRSVEPDLEFVEFKIRAPKARSVCLVGEFNAWKEGTLPMAKQGGGSWELALPLPRGRYRYLFVVDGEPRLDPANRGVAEKDGRRASVKEVP